MGKFHDDPIVDTRLRVCAMVALATHAPHDGDFSEMRECVAGINTAMRRLDELEEPARTITLSREERDVILDQLWRWTREDDGAVAFETREEATQSLADLHRAFDLRDELHGWPDADLDEPDTFTATVTLELVELLRTVAREYSESLPSDRESFKRAKAGDRDYWPLGALGDESHMIHSYEELIGGDEQIVRACSDVLDRLDAGAVTA